MTGPISMNRNDLIGIPDNPRYGYSAVNRTFVTNNFLKLDGSVAMTGDLKMGNHKIKDVGTPTADKDVDSVIIQSDDQDNDDVSLFIPNLKNYDSIAGRRKSIIVVNSIDNTFTGRIFLPSQSYDNKRWKQSGCYQ